MIATPDPDHARFLPSDRLKPHDLADLIDSVQFEPQAIVDEEIKDLALRTKSRLVEGNDDLDMYSGIGFLLGELPIAVMHYRGHPEHTSTIYLPFEMHGSREIENAVNRIVRELKIPRERIRWQRHSDLV